MQPPVNIVIIGHVDHGKSTIIGRLMADTGALPDGKLEKIQNYCRKNAKPFEYAFLLDALKDEQSQGITVYMARCFFQSKKQRYMIMDAPGHVDFIRNMVTGAARIDASEGIKENTRRQGYFLSLLNVKRFLVLVKKMDLVDYDENCFRQIRRESTEFFNELSLKPEGFIPISASKGVNFVKNTSEIPWYSGEALLEHLDSFHAAKDPKDAPFRMYSKLN